MSQGGALAVESTAKAAANFDPRIAPVKFPVRFSGRPRDLPDSHSHFDLQEHDKVVVRRSPHEVTLLHSSGHSYYRMLREKLGWSGLPRNQA